MVEGAGCQQKSAPEKVVLRDFTRRRIVLKIQAFCANSARRAVSFRRTSRAWLVARRDGARALPI
jgi:hypothetical protein